MNTFIPPFTVTLLLLALFSKQATAQEKRVRVQVRNEKQEVMPFATIVTNPVNDSLELQRVTANSSGMAFVLLKPVSTYRIRISSVNFIPLDTMISYQGEETLEFRLLPSAQTLKGVVVSSSRPLMREEDDMTIVDPENLVSSSTSGYEILEKTPGLFVDQDGNIYINSTTPASIYINGREMKMSAADVATMLKSLPPNAITRLEILRTPSAKYDASGAGGIVNVVLKKGIRLGMTGSATLGMQQGEYGNQLAGFNLNNNTGRLSYFLNLNYSRRDNFEQIRTDRLFAPDSLLSQDAYTRYPNTVYYLGYGFNYEAGSRWNLSYDGRISQNDFNNSTSNESLIQKISNQETITNNLARIRNAGGSFLLNQGFSGKYKIDSTGSVWTNDLAYTYARNNTDQGYITAFRVPVYPDLSGWGNSLNKRNFLTAQSDLQLKLQRRYTLETGIKTSLLAFNSETDYVKQQGNNEVKDEDRTNTFRYREEIHAAYVQGSKTVADIVLKMGLRVENTNMRGRQLVPGDTSFTIHRTDLFPYVYLSRKVITIAGFDLRAYLVYRRTITRPVYEQLNPFPRYVDQYLSEAGNPGLRPQFTQNYEANISVDETPLLAIGVNDTKDIFTNVIYQADSSQSQANRTYDNLGKNKEFYLRGLGAIPPGKKYFFVVGGQYNHNFYQGVYENRPLLFKKGSWTFFTYHTLKLGKYTQLTVNGFIRLKGQLQFYELGNFGALNASVNRKFFKEKLILTVSGNDLFATNRNDFTIQQGSVNASGFRRADTRRIGINLRYNFGIRKNTPSPALLPVIPENGNQ